MCITFAGSLTRFAIACTATGSVGDTTAASAKATDFGNCGINKCIKNPPTSVVNSTSRMAFPKIGPRNSHSSRLGKRQASLYRSGATNKSMNQCASTAIKTPNTQANIRPIAI